MINISVTIMAHPRRRRLVDELLEKLDRDVPVAWDVEDDPWETGSRALLSHRPDATHHLVLQDDAIPCRDLLAGVERLLEYVPVGEALGLYYGSRRPVRSKYEAVYRRAKHAGHRWIKLTGSPMWGVGLVLPVPQIDDVVAAGNAARGASYDGRVRQWYARNGVPCWYPIPSLIDHRTGPDAPSLLGRANPRAVRVAYEFIGEDASPLDVDWATGATVR